jgi:hypothetical protein
MVLSLSDWAGVGVSLEVGVDSGVGVGIGVGGTAEQLSASSMAAISIIT